MKRILALGLLIALPALAQVSPPSIQSRVAGRFVAYNYGRWSLPIYSFPSGTGSKTFTLSNSTVQLGDGRVIMPFNTNAQVKVGTETVTITAVGAGCIIGSTTTGGCSLTATFSSTHSNADRVSSATFGLQESLNDAGASGGGAVTVDSAWTGLGGTSGMISGATLPASTSIEDVRTGAPAAGVSQIVAGTNITLSPSGGTGAVTVNASGGAPSVAVSTSGPVTVTTAGYYFNNAAGALTFTLKTLASGDVGNTWCFRNSTTKTGAITLTAPASTSIDVLGVNGTAAGTLVSAGAAGDSVCLVAITTTQYMAYVGAGTWTNN